MEPERRGRRGLVCIIFDIIRLTPRKSSRAPVEHVRPQRGRRRRWGRGRQRGHRRQREGQRGRRHRQPLRVRRQRRARDPRGDRGSRRRRRDGTAEHGREEVRVAVVAGPASLPPVAVDGGLQLGGRGEVDHAALVGVEVFGVPGTRGRKGERGLDSRLFDARARCLSRSVVIVGMHFSTNKIWRQLRGNGSNFGVGVSARI